MRARCHAAFNETGLQEVRSVLVRYCRITRSLNQSASQSFRSCSLMGVRWMLTWSPEAGWMRVILAFFALANWGSSSAYAQTPRSWEIRGDTSGAPRGCSAKEGLDAIDAWFAAMNFHDSAALARVVPASLFVISIGSFAPTHSFFRGAYNSGASRVFEASGQVS